MTKETETHYSKRQLIENIATDLTNLLNKYVEETSFNDNDILEVIKQEADLMEY